MEVIDLLCLVVFGILGYVIKSNIVKDRRSDIVKCIFADVKEHTEVDWVNIDPALEELLKIKWATIMKKGVNGYYRHLNRALGRKATRIGE